ncbi:MAG TPA: hypothetical protein VJU16_03605, partial [Planctomycetota bacterium]|nr:hypothetical protein [Planctomycetota bacterium]
MKVMVDPKSPDHWKFRKLGDFLYGKSKVAKSCAIAAAFGHVNALWCRAMHLADDGRLVNWDDATVAERCHFGGDPKRFVAGLINAGFLEVDRDGTYVVHDWHEHQGDKLAERIYERDKKRRQREERRAEARRKAEDEARKAQEGLEDHRESAGSSPGVRREFTGSSPGVGREKPGDPPHATTT